jgi:hypothetical protein
MAQRHLHQRNMPEGSRTPEGFRARDPSPRYRTARYELELLRKELLEIT